MKNSVAASAGAGATAANWNTHIQIRAVAGLKAHPLSVRIYGAPTANDELLESVRTLGVLSAIIINKDGWIISGTSRHYAAQKCGRTEIPTVLFEGTPLAEELLVIESNRQRVKRPSVLGREFNERFRIEQELAAERQKAGVPPKVAEGGDARDKAAKAVNLGRTTAERLGKLMRRAEQFDTARLIVQDLDNGVLSIAAAYEKAFPPKSEGQPADCPECGLPFPSLTKLKAHGRHVHNQEPQTTIARLGFERKEPLKVVSIRSALVDAKGFSSRSLKDLNEALNGNPMLSPQEHADLLEIIAQLSLRIPFYQELIRHFSEVVAVQTSIPDASIINPHTGRQATAEFCQGKTKDGGKCFNYTRKEGYCNVHFQAAHQLTAVPQTKDSKKEEAA